MAYTVKGERNAVIAVTGFGTHTIVAQVTGKKIVIQKLHISTSAAVNVTILGSDGTTIAGPIPLAQYGQITWHADGVEWGHTTSGFALQLYLSGAATIGGYVAYTEE